MPYQAGDKRKRDEGIDEADPCSDCVQAALQLIRDTDGGAETELPDEGNGGSVTRGDNQQLNHWIRLCERVRRKQVRATCVIDFPYNAGGHLDPSNWWRRAR